MKKTFVLLTLPLSVLAFAACSDRGAGTAPEPQAVDKPAPVAEPMREAVADQPAVIDPTVVDPGHCRHGPVGHRH